MPSDILGAPLLDYVDAATVDSLQADAVIVAPGPGLTAEDLSTLSWRLEDAQVSVGMISVLDAVAPHRLCPGRLGDRLVVGIAPPRRSAWDRSIKAAIDRLLGAAFLVLAAPFLGALIILIRMDSPGPGIFMQTRVGLDGQPFRIFKLRTMTADAEASMRFLLETSNDGDGAHFKIKHDPRITRLGSFLRKNSLDELPQLVNVVLGDMSLVGPRPATALEVAKYDTRASRRLATKPGMTGRWQVSGRTNLSWNESVRLDVDYVDNANVSQDIGIMMRTIRVVLGREGAY